MTELIIPFTDDVAINKFRRVHGTNGELVRCGECEFASIGYYCGERIYTCESDEGLFRDVPEDGYCYCGRRRG